MRYAHTNIAARDRKTLSKFYIRVFDCAIKPPERKLTGDWLDQGAGLSNAELDGVPVYEDKRYSKGKGR